MESTSQETKEGISFADLGLDEVVLKAVEAKGFTEPSPIQVLAIPRLLNGDANIIAKARTGTGKTAAFGLPMIQELRADKQCPRALVLVPTRELAIQVATEIESFRTEQWRAPRPCTRSSIVEQLRALRNGVEIVRGTPDASSITSSAARSISPKSSISFSTKPTRCSTWDSSRYRSHLGARIPKPAA
jgi:superfamily II DNA/RNA helicase